MKKYSLLLFLLFVFNVGFPQISFAGLEGIKDTSDFPGLRRDIELQNFSIKMDSTYVAAYFKRASLEYLLGNYETSINEENEILRRFPDYAADAYSNRGMCYCMLKKYSLGIKDLEKTKQLTPSDHMSYLNLAYAQSGMLQFKAAILNLDTAIMLKPSYAKAFANRGFAKDKLEKYAEAIEDYNKALDIKPNYPEVYVNRACAEINLKKYDDAIADLNKAIEIFPLFSSSYEFYLNRGLAYEKKGDQANAKLDREKASLLRRNE